MKNKTKYQTGKKFYIIPAILLIIWVCIIWGHSMMPANISSGESSAILILANRMLSFTGITMTEFVIRKTGHFTEYAILGILLFSNYRNILQNKYKKVILRITSLFSGLLIALIDESIQYFTPGRSCEVRDVWIDFAGVCFGALLICYFVFKKDHT